MPTRKDVVELIIQAQIENLRQIQTLITSLEKGGDAGIETAASFEKLSTELTQLESQNALIQQFRDIVTNLKQANTALGESQREVNDLGEAFQRQTTALRQQKTEIEQTKATVSALSSIQEVQERQLKESTSALKKSVSEQKKLTEQQTEAGATVASLTDKLQEQVAQYNALKASIPDLNNLTKTQAKELGKLDRSITSTNAAIDEHKSSLAANQQTITNTTRRTAELASVNKQFEDSLAATNDDLASYERQLKKIESAQKTQNARLKETESQYKEAQTDLKKITASTAKLRTEFEKTGTALKQSGVNFNALDTETKKVEQSVRVLEQRIGALNTELTELRQRATAALPDVTERFRAGLERTRASLQALDTSGQTLDDIRASIGQLTSEFDKAGPELERFRSELDALKSQRDLIAQFKSLGSELDSTQQQLRTARDQASRLEAAFNSLTEPTKQNVAELRNARQVVSDLSAKELELAQTLNRIEGSLRDSGIQTKNLASAQKALDESISSSLGQFLKFGQAISAVDKASTSLKSVQNRIGGVADAINDMHKQAKIGETTFKRLSSQVDDLSRLGKLADDYAKLRVESDRVNESLKRQVSEFNALESEIKSVANPTATQIAAFEKSKIAIDQLRASQTELREQLSRTISRLRESGVALEEFSSAERVAAVVSDRLRNAIIDLNRQTAALSGAFSSVPLQRFSQLADGLRDRLTRLRGSMASVQGIAATFGASFGLREFAQLAIQVDSLDKALAAASGSIEKGAQDFQFIRQEADRLGLDLLSAAKAWTQFQAATRGSTLEGEDAKDIFLSVSGAMSILGKSSDDTAGALKAVEQIINKTVVQAEELRGQLSERLPGATRLAADALGITVRELFKMQERGELLATDLLPKLAKEINLTFGVDQNTRIENLSASINRLKSNFAELTKSFLEGGGGEFLQFLLTAADTTFKGLGFLFTTAKNQSEALAASFLSLSESLLTGDLEGAFERANAAGEKQLDQITEYAKEVGFIEEDINEAVKAVDLFNERLTKTADDADLAAKALDSLGAETEDLDRGFTRSGSTILTSLNSIQRGIQDTETAFRNQLANAIRDSVRPEDQEKISKQLLTILRDFSSQARTAAQDASREFSDNLSIDADKLAKGVELVLSGIRQGRSLDELSESISNALSLDEKALVDATKKALLLVEDIGKQSGQDLMDSIAEGVGEGQINLNQTFASVASAAASLVSREFTNNLDIDFGVLSRGVEFALNQIRSGKELADFSKSVSTALGIDEQVLVDSVNRALRKVIILGKESGQDLIAGVGEGINLGGVKVEDIFNDVLNKIELRGEIGANNLIKTHEHALSQITNTRELEQLRKDFIDAAEPYLDTGQVRDNFFSALLRDIDRKIKESKGGLLDFRRNLESIADEEFSTRGLDNLIQNIQTLEANSKDLAKEGLTEFREKIESLDSVNLEKLAQELQRIRSVADEESIPAIDKLAFAVENQLTQSALNNLGVKIAAVDGEFDRATQNMVASMTRIIEGSDAAGEGLADAFGNAINSLSDPNALNKVRDLLVDTFEQGRLNAEQFQSTLNQLNNQLISITGPEQLLQSVRDLNTESTQTAETMRLSLLETLRNLDAQSLERLQEQISQVGVASQQTQPFVQQTADLIQQALIEGAIQRIGIEAETAFNRMSVAEQQAIEDLRLVIESTKLTSEQLGAAFEKTIGKLKSGAAIEALRDIATGIGNGKLKADEFKTVIEAINEQLKELGIRANQDIGGINALFDGSLESVKQVNAQLEEERNKREGNADAQGRVTQATNDTNKAQINANHSYNQGKEAIKETEQRMASVGSLVKEMADKLADARAKFDGNNVALAEFETRLQGLLRRSGQEFAGFETRIAEPIRSGVDAATAKIQELQAELSQLRTGAFFIRPLGVTAFINSVQQAQREVQVLQTEQERSALILEESINRLPADQLRQKITRVRDEFRLLDGTRLDGLERTLQSRLQQIESMEEATARLRDELQRAQGDELGAAQSENARELLQIQQEINRLREVGDSQAVALLEEQLAIHTQLNRIEESNIANQNRGSQIASNTASAINSQNDALSQQINLQDQANSRNAASIGASNQALQQQIALQNQATQAANQTAAARQAAAGSAGQATRIPDLSDTEIGIPFDFRRFEDQINNVFLRTSERFSEINNAAQQERLQQEESFQRTQAAAEEARHQRRLDQERLERESKLRTSDDVAKRESENNRRLVLGAVDTIRRGQQDILRDAPSLEQVARSLLVPTLRLTSR